MKKITGFYFLFILLFLLICSNITIAAAQYGSGWTPQQRIPNFEDTTWPPILIADQYRTVHAFSYQWLNGNEGSNKRVIMYNQWTLDQGWTFPEDILLSPLKNDARLLDAILDPNGVAHVIFWGGDSTLANIYYSSAPIAKAGDAQAWSPPILLAANVQDPEDGVLYTAGQNNLGVVFSGIEDGYGLYSVDSKDGGGTWSPPSLIFNTKDRSNFAHFLKKFESDSGRVHLIWEEVTSGGQGRGIFYSNKSINDSVWSKPVELAEAKSGYGTNTPAVIEYNNVVYAFYNLDGKIFQLTSDDEGRNWTSPVQLFSRQEGVNGSLSLVVDSNDKLHMFFGQRVSGNPDIHGIWHSVYQGINWSEPEAIETGPQVADIKGNKAFDPYEARAVVSQGNVILVTWRSDPGLKGNGVWYSFKQLDAPQISLEPPDRVVSTSVSNSITSPMTYTKPSTPSSDSVFSETPPNAFANSLSNAPASLFIGIIPVFLLIVVVIFYATFIHRNHP